MARKKGTRTMFVIAKGNRDIEGVMIKMNALDVVTRFLQKVLPKSVVMTDRNHIIVIFPDDNKGDAKWMQDNVFRYVDVTGTASDAEAERRAEKAYDRYMAEADHVNNGVEKAGSGLLMHYLQQFYLIEKAASVFEVPI